MKSVLIAIPSGDTLHADFATSLSNMCLYSAYKCHHEFVIAGTMNHKTSRGPAMSRNEIVQKTLTLPGVTHLLMIDSDMTFPVHTIKSMLDRNCPIVGVNASTRTEPIRNTARLNGAVWELGCGVMLLDMEIFKTIPFPWFDCPYVNGVSNGEDIYFCRKAAECGILPDCDLELSKKIGHIGTKTFYGT